MGCLFLNLEQLRGSGTALEGSPHLGAPGFLGVRCRLCVGAPHPRRAVSWPSPGGVPGLSALLQGRSQSPEGLSLAPCVPRASAHRAPWETGLPVRGLSFPPPAAPPPRAQGLRGAPVLRSQATCSPREVPFERQLLSSSWVLFWEHKMRKSVPLDDLSLLSCVPSRIYSRSETGALLGRPWS